MTNEQLWLAIGVPIAFQAILFTVLMWAVTGRIDAVKEIVQTQLNAFREVVDARLKSIEKQLEQH